MLYDDLIQGRMSRDDFKRYLMLRVVRAMPHNSEIMHDSCEYFESGRPLDFKAGISDRMLFRQQVDLVIDTLIDDILDMAKKGEKLTNPGVDCHEDFRLPYLFSVWLVDGERIKGNTRKIFLEFLIINSPRKSAPYVAFHLLPKKVINLKIL
ncbi:MAG: hypothetical protein KKF56_04770 [Nanoarchaeota archaeon]|nr:hypothetical protein [Nanoarchaeota archaeon]